MCIQGVSGDGDSLMQRDVYVRPAVSDVAFSIPFICGHTGCLSSTFICVERKYLAVSGI